MWAGPREFMEKSVARQRGFLWDSVMSNSGLEEVVFPVSKQMYI